MDTLDSRGFYDALAGEYDRMIPVERRLAAAAKLVGRLMNEQQVRRAVDLATGTGVYALALAGAGVETIGLDLSPAMLAQAEARARALDIRATWLEGPMQHFAGQVTEPVDLIVCLGNSLPHLHDDADLAALLDGAAARLNPGGRLILQFINYQRVLAGGNRIVAITRHDDTEYVRFYDLLDRLVRFNILAIRWTGDKAAHELQSTTLRPWLADEVADAMRERGFERVSVAADFAGGEFAVKTSEAVVVSGWRGA